MADFRSEAGKTRCPRASVSKKVLGTKMMWEMKETNESMESDPHVQRWNNLSNRTISMALGDSAKNIINIT